MKLNLHEIIAAKKRDVIEYLWSISTLKKSEGIKLNSQIYDEALVYIEDSMRFSTRQKFQGNKFWKDLHPMLQ